MQQMLMQFVSRKFSHRPTSFTILSNQLIIIAYIVAAFSTIRSSIYASTQLASFPTTDGRRAVCRPWCRSGILANGKKLAVRDDISAAIRIYQSSGGNPLASHHIRSRLVVILQWKFRSDRWNAYIHKTRCEMTQIIRYEWVGLFPSYCKGIVPPRIEPNS